MRPGSQPTPTRQGETERFLLHQTRPEPDPFPPLILDDRTAESALKQRFPALLTGQAFLDAALARMRRCLKFCVLALRPDPVDAPAEGAEAADPRALLLVLGQVLDTVCREKGGVWGAVGSRTLGCFFPERSSRLGLEIAEDIQNRLAEILPDSRTVSIGVAGYPLIRFARERIWENAVKALDHAGLTGPGARVAFDATSLNISGDKQYSQGDIQGAIREYQTALLLEPSHVNLHNSLGVCYGQLGEYENALAAFEAASQLDAHDPMAVYNQGLIHLLQGERETALACFLTANDRNPAVFELALQTGRLYLEKGKPGTALAYLKKAVDLKPEGAAAHRFLGDAYFDQNQLDKALRAYKKAVKHNPHDHGALSAIGHIFDLQGENPEIAELFCRQSVELAPATGLYRYRLARLLLKLDRPEEALNEFIQAQHQGYYCQADIQALQARFSGGG